MNDSNKREFSDLLDAAMPIYRMEASVSTKRIWWELLKNYEINAISIAVSEHLRINNRTITPADIVLILDRIKPDGRPSPDEAWAMIPRDEYTSCVMTEEMGEALHVAQPLLNEGDQVAARMAFKEAYARLVDANKRAGIKPKWFPSLGMDKEARESVLAEAVRLGRLGADHAMELLPPDKVAPMLEMAGEKKLALEHKPVSTEQARANIAKIKAVLENSKIAQHITR